MRSMTAPLLGTESDSGAVFGWGANAQSRPRNRASTTVIAAACSLGQILFHLRYHDGVSRRCYPATRAWCGVNVFLLHALCPTRS
jgi:hypothetical protein